ncbi:DUF397 domain-containing protein [Streptomyces sp. A3M-1-3]|uniref:DUF397 domain-containing protein n=1 Tax=Streptomyces sp. A3M-1-3 TaxID=2962044 RepID=UPI0020B7445A|nr:DUF397 domain-containing protein [Streptomyces sp. A3M-1-3]MCP3820167.1 DUF397 domain-containing protein [Streptomyces sp. A3M-1-3]
MSARHAYEPSPGPSLGPSLNRARWRRSSRSTGMNNCVEAARLDGGLLAVRDSKHLSRPALLFSAGAWESFVSYLRNHPARDGS